MEHLKKHKNHYLVQITFAHVCIDYVSMFLDMINDSRDRFKMKVNLASLSFFFLLFSPFLYFSV